MEMPNDDCIPCKSTGVEQNFEEKHWLALINAGVKGLGGELNTLSCYDSKKQWKKIEIIHDIKDRT
tara:strand:- start:426 stop:623 length:198 start_codon:yes stop_codon:yes gene_type:complete